MQPSELGSWTLDQLVTSARGGDRRAFGELVRRYRPRIFALSLHLCGSSSEADDITQDAFMRAFRRIRDFQGRSQFFTWLYRIALNRALNGRRDQQRRALVSLSDDRVRAAVAVDGEGDPRRMLELSERYALLLSALDLLSPELRSTVVLCALQGLSQREAAIVLEVSEGTVGWRMHTAKNRLQATLERLQREPTPLPRARLLSFDELFGEVGALEQTLI
jgi:RNA polymerase sigma-70 factor (ECF subfamily)